MKAQIEIESKNPEMIIKAIAPDIDAKKFDVDLQAKRGKLILTVKSEDFAGLLAGINSYMKLIRTAKNVEEI